MLKRLAVPWALLITALAPAAAAANPNLALPSNGGIVSASSEYWSAAYLTDGSRSGHWADVPGGPEPAWAQVRWEAPQRLSKVVLRMPVVSSSLSAAVRTFGELRVQFWDGSAWVDVDAVGNPIEDWLIPTVDDGSQVKTLVFDDVQTTKIRVLFVEGNATSDAGLEEIEAWGNDVLP